MWPPSSSNRSRVVAVMTPRIQRLALAVGWLGLATWHGVPAAAQAQGKDGGMGGVLPHSGSIGGQVVDLQSRAPVLGATVNLVGTHLHSATDSVGRFRHPSLSAGTYIIEVRAIGYGVTSWVLHLAEGEVVDYVFELSPIGFALDPIV